MLRMFALLLVAFPGLALAQNSPAVPSEKTVEAMPLALVCFDHTESVKTTLDELSKIYLDGPGQEWVSQTTAPYLSIMMKRERAFAGVFANPQSGGLDVLICLPIETTTEKLVDLARSFGQWSVTRDKMPILNIDGQPFYLSGRGNHVMFSTSRELFDRLPQNPEKLIRGVRGTGKLVRLSLFPKRFNELARQTVGAVLPVANGEFLDGIDSIDLQVDFEGGDLLANLKLNGHPGSFLQTTAQSEASGETDSSFKWVDTNSAAYGFIRSRSAIQLLDLVEAALMMQNAMLDENESDDNPKPWLNQVVRSIRAFEKIELAFSFTSNNDRPSGILGVGIGQTQALVDAIPKTSQVSPSPWRLETSKKDATGNEVRTYVGDDELILAVNASEDTFDGEFSAPANRLMSLVLKADRLLDIGKANNAFEGLPGFYVYGKQMTQRFPGKDGVELTIDATQTGFQLDLRMQTAVLAGTFYVPFQLGSEIVDSQPSFDSVTKELESSVAE